MYHHQSVTHDTTRGTSTTSVDQGFHERTTLSLNATIRSHSDEDLWEEDEEDVKLDTGSRFCIVDNLKVGDAILHSWVALILCYISGLQRRHPHYEPLQ